MSEVGSDSETRYSVRIEVKKKFQRKDTASLSHLPLPKPYIAELARCVCHILGAVMCTIFVAS